MFNKIFKRNDGKQFEVRVHQDMQGDPWFVAGDACKVLDLGNVTMALSRLTPSDLRTFSGTESLPGFRRDTRWINESGLYDLILDSRKPEAKQFRRWITSEVLPTIRKTGSYQADDVLQAAMQQLVSDPAAGLMKLAELRKRVDQAEALVEEQAPKVSVYDQIMASEGDYDVVQAAKVLAPLFGGELGRNRLFALLVDEAILIKNRKGYRPYQHAAHHFRTLTCSVEHGNGSFIATGVKIKPSGLVWLFKRFEAKAEAV
ncbi:BRO family protein [Streptomyces sp. NPDC050485]|uniref:BRO family protein n=1 Tax=Streptomyces sp. NPDC050485 TaxID=3365617 RepID=UPI00379E2E91